MTPTEFCYWLQGRAELLPDQPPTADEWKMIREHLALVFVKVTPPKQAPSPSPSDLLRQYEQIQRAQPMRVQPQWIDPMRVTC